MKIAIALSALLFGVVLGRWSAQPDRRSGAAAASSRSLPHERSLTNKAPTPQPDQRTAEHSPKEAQHPNPEELASVLQERNSSAHRGEIAWRRS